MSDMSTEKRLSRVSADPEALQRAASLKTLPKRRPQQGFNAHMLSEDLGLMHYAYDTEVHFEGIDHDDGSRLLGELLDDVALREWWPDVDHYVWDLVRVVCDDLLRDGRCLFEVHLAEPRTEASSSSRQRRRSVPAAGRGEGTVRLGRVPSWSIRKRPWGVSQAQPAGDAIEWVQLPKDRLVNLTMPDHLDRRMRKTNQALRTVDKYHLTGLDLVSRGSQRGYDFSLHQKASEDALARCTADIGWDGRSLFDQRATSAHLTYRRLRFLRTWLTVVNASVTMLNRVTLDPSFYPNSQFTLELKGLPTIAAVNVAIDDLLSGRTAVDPVRQGLLFPRSYPKAAKPE